MSAFAEQETIIRWDRDERMVNIYTTDPIVRRQCLRLGLVPYRESGTPDKWVWSDFRTPLDLFRWRLKRNRPQKVGEPRKKQGFALRTPRVEGEV